MTKRFKHGASMDTCPLGNSISSRKMISLSDVFWAQGGDHPTASMEKDQYKIHMLVGAQEEDYSMTAISVPFVSQDGER
jgi:hypothetical protein